MNAVERETNKKVVQWLEFADEDLRFAEHGLKLKDDCPCRLIAYHAQQCAEKHLKAYLVFHGKDFPYTHDLQELLAECAEIADWPGGLKSAKELTYYAISTRYPGEADEVTLKEAVQAVELAKDVKAAVRKALKEEGFRNGKF